jgi:hypothetical protein
MSLTAIVFSFVSSTKIDRLIKLSLQDGIIGQFFEISIAGRAFLMIAGAGMFWALLRAQIFFIAANYLL